MSLRSTFIAGFVLYDPVARQPFDPSRARGDSFAGGLFDPTPVAKPAAVPPSIAASPSTPAATRTPGASTGDEATPSAASPSIASQQKDLTVSQFSELISRTLEDGMRGTFRVQGEIGNLSERGHWYFSVKDASAVLSCVMWQNDAARVGFRPREGDAVVVTGRIKHFAPQGKTQLYATKLERQGLGTLEQQFQALVRELRGLGYFEESRKKLLPEFPRRVAVITSRTGAALQDVLKTAGERCPAVEFLVIDVRVQGDGAAGEVARALRAVNAMHASHAIDAVIVTRGGGSREDLWAFNERVVADAAHELEIPLVAAIGHEVDTSVIELVADRRASTPTQAVMLLLPDLAGLAARHEGAARELRNAMRWRISALRDRLSDLAASPALASPALRIAQARERVARLDARARAAMSRAISTERRALDAVASRLIANAPAARAAAARAHLGALGPRLTRAVAATLATSARELTHLEHRLRSAGPEQTLQRGYAIVTAADGTLVRSVSAAAAGSQLTVQLADGTMPVRVESPQPPRPST
jgi:exodeoxyribonuclease VII large subunit